MARAMMVIAVCDGCKVRGDEQDFMMDVVLDIPPITKKPKIMDLCTGAVEGGDDCYDRFTSSLAEWIGVSRPDGPNSRIAKPERTPSPSTTSNSGPVCDVPGCAKGPGGTPFVAKSSTGLTRHKTRYHGSTPTTAAGRQRRAEQDAAQPVPAGV